MNAEAILRAGVQRARVVWIAMLAATGMYVVVLFQMTSRAAKSRAPDAAVIGALVAAALGAAVVSLVLPRRIYATRVRAMRFETAESEPVPGMAPRRTFANPAAAARGALQAGFQSFILSVALSEVVALLGFVLRLQGGPWAAAGPLFAIGLALVAMRFPTRAAFVTPFESAFSATFDGTTGY